MPSTPGNKGPLKQASTLMLFLIIGLGVFTTTSLLSAGLVGKVYDKKAIDIRLSNHPKLVIVHELDHEILFRNTIKSCLPSETQKCRTFTPVVNGSQTQRIAVISLPGDASKSLYQRMLPIQNWHNAHKDASASVINTFTRTSVPPYGYGKTHGLTKIVRLVPQPLALEATDALQRLLRPGESHTTITLHDLKAALRQILRFHCRVSAVAAHTSLLSISYMEMMDDMEGVVSKLQAFLAPDDPPPNPDPVPKAGQAGLFDAQESYGTQIFTHLQETTHVDVHKILDQVLMEELSSSKNLTIWPCPSFWSVGDEPNPLDISPLVQRLAKALSPDCDDPLADCWVQRDKCEAKGDGLCTKR